MTKPVWTVDQIAEHLIRDRTAWSGDEPVAYSFYVSPAAHLGQVPNFSTFSPDQRQALHAIFDLIADLVPLTFMEVPDNGAEPGPGNERIGFFNLNASTVPFWGSANNFQTAPEGEQFGLISGADVVVNLYRANAQGDWEPGDSNVRKLMHEALHTLGVSHPGDYNGDGAIDYENEAEYRQDSTEYTVMSYWAASNTGADHSTGGALFHAATPLLHDIAALQRLYGANMATRTGDTVYGFNSTAGRPAYDIALNPHPIFSIWDAAGIDTLDLSGFATASQVNLAEGGFSDAGGLTRNISIAYGAVIENAIGGAGDDRMSGNSAANRLDGGGGADTLIGAGGSDMMIGGVGGDTMSGGDGDDRYVVDAADDKVVESIASGGIDGVDSAVAFSLAGQYLEKLTLTGAAMINGTGNGLANILVGNAAANLLDGAAGADTMSGGGGSDRYIVDHAGDRAIETSAGAGTDTVESAVSFSLAGGYVDNLTLTGSAASATGNGLANILVGNAAANLLNGAAGADRMSGGGGSDRYIVDHVGDRAVETSGSAGSDTVESAVSFSLAGGYVDHLTLTGSAASNATGNGLANLLVGNAAANVLNGGAGADTMTGGAGGDRYVVDHVGDRVLEAGSGGGIDTVESSVAFSLAGQYLEHLTLTGGRAVSATGNGLANALTGNDAANRLYGGGGNDSLRGNGGADGFYFDSALNASTNVDRILDFSVADDTIFLDRTIFKGIAGGVLASAAFANGAAASTAAHRIVYDKASGNIFYDADGSGATAAVLFAQVGAGATLTHLDFTAYI